MNEENVRTSNSKTLIKLSSFTGDLTKVLIEHDNKGFGAGWFLERVEVINQASNRTWTFPCAKWLDKSRGDGTISRELYPRD